jgi:hypothetical protein
MIGVGSRDLGVTAALNRVDLVGTMNDCRFYRNLHCQIALGASEAA